MLTDDIDQLVYGLSELACDVPPQQGRVNVSPLEIMDEIKKYVQELTEKFERIVEKNKKVSAETDELKERLHGLKELVCKQRSEEELKRVIDLDKQRSDSAPVQAASESRDFSSFVTMAIVEHDYFSRSLRNCS